MAEQDLTITVEQYLTRHCDIIISDLRQHGADVIARLRDDYELGEKGVQKLLAASLSSRPLIVTLKCIGGAHIGQKFRLETATSSGEDSFKVGRSTGRHFKEKGVSLYKDKEISTTHAKVRISFTMQYGVPLTNNHVD
jgi:hypothetical protein